MTQILLVKLIVFFAVLYWVRYIWRLIKKPAIQCSGCRADARACAACPIKAGKISSVPTNQLPNN